MIPVKDKSKIKIKLPPKVQEVLGTIMAAGYEAYAVGGASGIPCLKESRETGISQPLRHHSR